MYVIIGCKNNSFIDFSAFFHYLFLHLRGHSKVDMQALLNDIELDIQELKYLMEAVSHKSNPALREVAKRNIMQMRDRLDVLLEQLDREVTPESELSEAIAETVQMAEPVQSEDISTEIEVDVDSTPIETERIKTSKNLRCLISLNDSFRFSRELFEGSMEQMNHVLQQIAEMHSLDAALFFLSSQIKVEEENESKADLVELLKKYFT